MSTKVMRKGENEEQREAGATKHRPVWSKAGFPVSVAVFEFTSDTGIPNFSVKLSRTFRRDESSPWEHSDYLGGHDLLRAASLLQAADGFIQNRLAAAHRSKKEEGEQF